MNSVVRVCTGFVRVMMWCQVYGGAIVAVVNAAGGHWSRAALGLLYAAALSPFLLLIPPLFPRGSIRHAIVHREWTRDLRGERPDRVS